MPIEVTPLTEVALPSNIFPMDADLTRRMGARIRKLRTSKGWTQGQLADEIWRLERLDDPNVEGPKVNGSYVSRWENGDQRPRDRYQALIARAFDAPTEVLYTLPLDDRNKAA